MLGSITNVPNPGTQGLIDGDDGAGYMFTFPGWRDQATVATPGMRVEFIQLGSRAVDIRPAPGAIVVAQHSNPGIRRGRPFVSAVTQPAPTGNAPAVSPPGRSTVQDHQRRRRGQGSMGSAIKSMAMIFLITPLSLPLLLLIPLLGRLELTLMALAPGFLGGMKAGSIGAAMAAAIIVGAVYAVFHYFLVLALLHFLVGVPFVGGPVESALQFIGGFGISSSLVAALITFPFILALVISALLGAASDKITHWR